VSETAVSVIVIAGTDGRW